MCMAKVSVTAYYDNSGAFYPNGKLVVIDTTSMVGGIIARPGTQYVQGYPNTSTYVEYLELKDSDIGAVYVDMTIDEWSAAVSAAQQSPNVERTVTYTVPADTAAGTTITKAALYNVTINAIIKNGTALDIRTVTYTQSTTNLTGTLTFGVALVNTDVVSVVYYKN